MNQLAPILDLLKETDNKVIPDYTPSASGNITVAEKSNFTSKFSLIKIIFLPLFVIFIYFLINSSN